MTDAALRIMHASMQFSDSKAQHKSDSDAVIRWARDHGVAFLTGTEAGGDSMTDALREAAKRYGFALNLHQHGEWVALNKTLAEQMATGFAGPFIPGTRGLSAAEGGHAPRGIAWTTAKPLTGIGTVTVGVAHYLTKRSIEATGVTNKPLVEGIAAWGKDKGRGSRLVFINADVNQDDEVRDPFLGNPFTTCWDELNKYPATHGRDKTHGTTIDVSASYNDDGRVVAKTARVLDDGDLPLAADHFPLVATYSVQRLEPTPT